MAKTRKTTIPETTLEAQILSALQSRDDRGIRRRLPDPTETKLVDFNSNDYLSLSTDPRLREKVLNKLHSAPEILGSGGSRLLINGHAHSALEARLTAFFGSGAAILFNSGFDANVGFFSCIPQLGDVVLYDEYIHASVHDGLRASRAASASYPFEHNSLPAFKKLISKLTAERPELLTGGCSLFVAVESLYSMDGTFAPLVEISEILEDIFPRGNAYLVVDEAHATGIYGPQGRGRVAELGLEGKVLARLHTFGKALAASGAVILTTPLVRDFLLNYARPLIYTTALSAANVVAADASFDLLMDGTVEELSKTLLSLSASFVSTLQATLHDRRIPMRLVSLPAHLALTASASAPTSAATPPPAPIIPLHTPHAHALSAHLRALGINARPITWPTVPQGKDRVRVCLHAGNARGEVRALVGGVVAWAEGVLRGEREGGVVKGEGEGVRGVLSKL